MSKLFRSAASAAIVLMLSTSAFAQNTYDVNFTSNPPTIDGVVSPGEWDDAAGPEGGWRVLRQAGGPTDSLNNRFRLKWDDTFLYLLAESDHDAWTTNQRDQYRGGANNLNIYFDPDLDGEGNQGSENAPFSTPDGYQIAVNQYLGSYQCLDSPCSVDMTPDNTTNPIQFGATGSNLSTFAEAHIDGLFGNQGGWLGMRGTQIATINSTDGGVVEMAIPWTDFDAPNMDENGEDPGLNIMGAAPVAGDEWIFNIAEIVNGGPAGNDLPAWNWHDNPNGNEFFAAQPHGVITFVDDAVAPQVASVELNVGEAQRSAVEAITVEFDSEVSLADGAFSLVQRSTATEETFDDVSVIVTEEVINDQTIATIEFDSHVRNADNALVDGNYQLTVNASLVTNGGAPMVEDFVFGAVESDGFFTFYGDADGNRTLNVFDLLSFRQTFLVPSDQPGFAFFLDFNASGLVDVFDLLQFRQRFGITIPFTFGTTSSLQRQIGGAAVKVPSTVTRAIKR